MFPDPHPKSAALLATPEVFERLARQGVRLRGGLAAKMGASGLAMRANGGGSMSSLQFFREPARSYRKFYRASGEHYLQRMQRLHRAMLNEGVLMATRGMMIGSTPMTDADFDETVERCGRALEAFAASERVAA